MSRDLLWSRRLERRLAILDALVITGAMLTAHLLRFGVDAHVPLSVRAEFDVSYTLIGIVLTVLWWVALHLWNSRDVKVLGVGFEEYKRVIVASFAVFSAVALISYAFQAETARGYVGIALPLGVCLLLAGRWGFRQHIRRQRSVGRYIRRMLLIGHPDAAEHLAQSLLKEPGAGYVPAAALVPQGVKITKLPSTALPVLGQASTLESITEVVDSQAIDAVALSAGSDLPPSVVRRLGWELQAREISLIMAPALTDVAGPRIHTQPIAGLPLIHVATPKLEGVQAASKRTFDALSSLLGLLILSPIFLVLAIAIKLDSPGPVFFQQRRIGKDGVPFTMHKFRSMVVDAEARLAEFQDQHDGNGVLFKLKDDPRITKLGAFIRRYSLDELPQLWNVLTGTMSLVGPRPPLPQEVAVYEDYVHRRLMVKPGITGLWQVSGRSDLSWDDSVRLDLYYVENWSLTQDLLILAKTARAVIGKDGAY